MTIARVWRSKISSTRQSNEASASTSAGAPVMSGNLSPSNRASPSTPLRPAKREASAPCWAARIFTAKAPACVSTASVDEQRSRQITSEGGDSESEASAIAVHPALFSVRACHDRDARGEFAHREAKIPTLGVRMHPAHRFSVTTGSSSTSGSVRMIGRWCSCIGLLAPAQTNGLSPSHRCRSL
jgi:hypothetical protein